MTERTSELDLSVARLLRLAEQIERRDVAPPFVSAVPDDESQPCVIADAAPGLEELSPEAPFASDADDAADDPWAEVFSDLVADDLLAEAAPAEDAPAVAAVEPLEEDPAPDADLDDIVDMLDDVDETYEPLPVEPMSVLVLPTHAEPAPVAEPRAEDYLARLEQVRAELTDLAARRRRPRGRRRLEDARREERELLDKLGFDSYLDLMLANAGTRQSESLPASASSTTSGRAKGERDGNGGGAGGGGASSDMGSGGSGFSFSMAPPPAPPAPSIWYPPAPEIEVVAEPDAAEPEMFDDGGDSPVPFGSGAPTIADWLASPLAPGSASSIDVGA